MGYVDGMSLYEYVKSDPIGNTDPSGLQADDGPGSFGSAGADFTGPTTQPATTQPSDPSANGVDFFSDLLARRYTAKPGGDLDNYLNGEIPRRKSQAVGRRACRIQRLRWGTGEVPEGVSGDPRKQ